MAAADPTPATSRAAARAARRRRRRTARSARSSASRSRCEPGRVLALLGSNGCGQDDRSRACAPVSSRRPRARCCFDGDDDDGWRAVPVSRALGIIHAPEGRSVFAIAHRRGEPRAHLPPRVAGSAASRGGARRRRYELFPRLGERRQQIAGTLSGGEQRMLSLSRVLVEHAAAARSPTSCRWASLRSSSTRCTGRSSAFATRARRCCIVEQHVHHALEIADDAIVLIKGEVSVRGPGVRARRPPHALVRRRLLIGNALTGLGAEQ